MTARCISAIAIGLVVGGSGCGRDEVFPTDGPVAVDAPPVIDAGPTFDAWDECLAAPGTADVDVSNNGPATTFNRLYAGAIWAIGPVAPPAAPGGPDAPIGLHFLITDVNRIGFEDFACCSDDGACCTLDGVDITTDGGTPAEMIGTHPAQFEGVGSDLMITGTITITEFETPFPQGLGHVAGSVSATMGGDEVTGTFDNTFCPALLSATI